MAFDHLRPHVPVLVNAIERVKDEIPVVSRRSREGHSRIKDDEIVGRGENQLVWRFSPCEPWHRRGRRSSDAGGDEFTSTHATLLLCPIAFQHQGPIKEPMRRGSPEATAGILRPLW